MTEKEKEQLRKLNDKEKQKKYTQLKRWHTLKSPIKLVHIYHTSKQAPGIHASVELKKRIEKIYQYNPQYKRPLANIDHVGSALVMVGVFHLLGYIDTPLYPYIMYTLYMNWDSQEKIRCSRRRQKELMYHIDSFHLISMILKEAQSWMDRHPDELQYITPKYNPTVLEEIKEAKEYGLQ